LTDKKGDKTDCSNYRGISLLPTTYNILSNILLSSLTPYVDEIIGDNQCVFCLTSSSTDQMLEKNGSAMGQYISYLQTSRKHMSKSREKYSTTLSTKLVYP
jgi:hypothetical protein